MKVINSTNFKTLKEGLERKIRGFGRNINDADAFDGIEAYLVDLENKKMIHSFRGLAVTKQNDPVIGVSYYISCRVTTLDGNEQFVVVLG